MSVKSAIRVKERVFERDEGYTKEILGERKQIEQVNMCHYIYSSQTCLNFSCESCFCRLLFRPLFSIIKVNDDWNLQNDKKVQVTVPVHNIKIEAVSH